MCFVFRPVGNLAMNSHKHLFFDFGPKFSKSLIVPVPGGHEYEKSAHKTLEPFFELNHNLSRHCAIVLMMMISCVDDDDEC